ncbi:hypothetical protein HF086_005952 [Spodoptera exigua]|uniref:Large ribosomal subunit protein mL38 n=1 Tax=Spodoptera exigua TaxID=7107 RepID=A0A922M6E5_SPOEX|nr:hypothetical protein HF086_005952 [Spodoptera exigua]
MLNSFRGVWAANIQLQQIRCAHRIRGKAPIFCRTIKERLDELNYKDELYTTRIDIGLPQMKKLSEGSRRCKLDHLKKIKADKNLEQLARNHTLEIDLNEAKKEWLNTLGPQHKKQIADHYGIFEHLYGEGYFIPYLNLEVLYDLKNGSYLPVYTGNDIKPAEALEYPIVNYESDPDSLWTLALTSLDGHLTEGDKEYVHWLVANIPGNSIEKGDTIVEYLQPIPLKGTGYHRYAYVLYKQDGNINYDVTKEDRTFVTREWYQKYQDNITPAGLAFFQTNWDISVRDFFHKINKEYLLRKLKDEDPFKAPPPPLKFPNAQPFPKNMPSWLKLHEKKIRLGWGRVNDV